MYLLQRQISERMTPTTNDTHVDGKDDSTTMSTVLRQRIASLLLKITQIENILLRSESQSAVNHQIDTTTSAPPGEEEEKKEGEELRIVLNEYIAELDKLYDEANRVFSGNDDDKQVPVEIIEYVDDGGNPDECMRRVMGSVLQESQQCRGKSLALQSAAASMNK
jgi:hypothetical protein